jgi:hypothetical protein
MADFGKIACTENESNLVLKTFDLGMTHKTNFTLVRELYIILISVTWAVPSKRPVSLNQKGEYYFFGIRQELSPIANLFVNETRGNIYVKTRSLCSKQYIWFCVQIMCLVNQRRCWRCLTSSFLQVLYTVSSISSTFFNILLG